MKPIAAILTILLCTAAASAGCVRVKPYQRETLAKRGMQSPVWPNIVQADQHVFAVREGSGGATGNAGGGCGCN